MEQAVLQNTPAHYLHNDAWLQIVILVATLDGYAGGSHYSFKEPKSPFERNQKRANPQNWQREQRGIVLLRFASADILL